MESKDIFVMGCNHVGQTSMLKYRPEFSNMKEHDNATWDLLDQVRDDQCVLFLGDSFISPWSLNVLKKYKFKKILVLGNHEFDMGNTIQDYADVMDEVHGCLKIDNLIFTHAPIAYKSMAADAINIHAHIHTNVHFSRRHFNVNMEALCYRLISLDQILQGKYKQFDFFDGNPVQRLCFEGDNQEGHIYQVDEFIYSKNNVLIGRVVEFKNFGQSTELTMELNESIFTLKDEDNFNDVFHIEYLTKSKARISIKREF